METRHTAWFIEYADGSNVLIHVSGGHGFFETEERWDVQPGDSNNWERTIPVATLRTQGGTRNLVVRDRIWQVRVNNEDRGWNCQTFIGDGFAELTDIIPENVITSAVDTMAGVLMEAPDEA